MVKKLFVQWLSNQSIKGLYSVLDANSLVNKNIEEYDIVGGVPAKKISNRNEIIKERKLTYL